MSKARFRRWGSRDWKYVQSISILVQSLRGDGDGAESVMRVKKKLRGNLELECYGERVLGGSMECLDISHAIVQYQSNTNLSIYIPLPS
jgi:hypothetical protein